ncbi:MAG: enolase C-terminal domain-like protein, partial [Gemmatales bacterium]|nr:dipeptide epimerase [Gemmatales bacterium]MDW8176186.1 enolase C-terminal domain-like protein [Gemmatales bacterium]
ELDDGTVGYGEGAPREYVTGESVADAPRWFQNRKLHRFLSFLRPRSFAEAVEAIAELPWEYPADDERQCRGNAARCALELALLDAYGRYFRQPLSRATAVITPELYQPRSEVRYSGVITGADGWKLKAAALAMRAYGFRDVKVKVGMAGANDGARLRTVRRWCGWGVGLRVDANEAWSPTEVLPRLAELQPFGLLAVEQPVRHADRAVLRKVRQELRLPIMLDESLCSFTDAKRAVAEETCDLFNLRLSKCGGFIPTLLLARFARQHGLGYQLGCQVGESAILSAAGRHFACSVAGVRWCEGSYDRFLLRDNLSRVNLTFGWGGWAPALQGAGLGIAVSSDSLRRLSIRQEEIFDIVQSAAFDLERQ